MMKANEFPRRNRLDLNTPAELAIYNALQEVEKVGADERLTESVILLGEAKDQLSDFIDNVPFKRRMEYIKPIEPLLKITVYKKGKEYHMTTSGKATKENMDIILPSEKEYKEAIDLYKMTNVISVFDECYTSIYE